MYEYLYYMFDGFEDVSFLCLFVKAYFYYLFNNSFIHSLIHKKILLTMRK